MSTGVIAFLGSIVSDLFRMTLGSNHRPVGPVSAFLGGMLLREHVITRAVLGPTELLVDILTGPMALAILAPKGDSLAMLIGK